jgi:3-hydroxyisobutyrate dehydrogenase-like beta-hydroxyacid dehydrogenase
MAEKVGFVGLGIMGAAMAKNLLGAGHDLMVHNRTKEKAEALGALGSEVSDSPGEVAQKSGVVITMLPGPPEVRQVVAGEGGLLDSAQEGSLIVDMSTSSPALARELHRGGQGSEAWGRSTPPYPVATLGPQRARSRSWSAGDEEDFRQALPLFEGHGRRRSSTSERPGPARRSSLQPDSRGPRHRGGL